MDRRGIPAMTRVTALELHQKLGQTIDKARLEPVVVTKHDRDHVVIVSAERYEAMARTMRRVRLTGSLTDRERALAAKGKVPSKKAQKRYLAELALAVERSGL
jgi:prevent-host-death family protein